MIRNLRDLPHSLTLSALVSSLVAVLVGYTGPLLIVVQAAENAGLDRARIYHHGFGRSRSDQGSALCC